MTIQLHQRVKTLEQQLAAALLRIEELEKPKRRGPGRPRKDGSNDRRNIPGD